VEAFAVSATDSAKAALTRFSERAKWEDILGALGTARHCEVLRDESLRALAENSENAKRPVLIFALLLLIILVLHAVFVRDIPAIGSLGSMLLGWGSLILQNIIYFLSAITLFITLIRWYAYIKAFGWPSHLRCSRTVRSRALINGDSVLGNERFACNHTAFTYLVIAFVLALINTWADSHLILSLVVFQLIMAIWIFLGDACPPVVLAVAPSTEEGFRLQAALKLVLTQHFESAALLDLTQDPVDAKSGYARLGSKLRVLSSEEWLSVGCSLVEVVRVVIFDAGCNTPAVVQLATHSLQARWAAKVTLLYDPAKPQPLIVSLAKAGVPVPPQQVLSTNDWPRFINEILCRPQSLQT
jgi:hypothetical protein